MLLLLFLSTVCLQLLLCSLLLPRRPKCFCLACLFLFLLTFLLCSRLALIPLGVCILVGYVVFNGPVEVPSTQVRYTLYSVSLHALKRSVTSLKNGEPGRP